MAYKKRNQTLYIVLGGILVSFAIALSWGLARLWGLQIVFAKGGFDEFGYNYTARVFEGAADGVDRNLDQTVWGDPTYGEDHLVMKWSKGWDDARFNGAPWGPDAWEDNEWNGKVPGGSGETWHYKIVWVGTGLESSPYWKPGGYPIWGQFEVIFSQGTIENVHSWETHANPAGYGMMK